MTKGARWAGRHGEKGQWPSPAPGTVPAVWVVTSLGGGVR